jgi:hypothetical protein
VGNIVAIHMPLYGPNTWAVWARHLYTNNTNKCFARRIHEAEIEEALKRMKGGKRWTLMVSPLRCGDVWVNFLGKQDASRMEKYISTDLQEQGRCSKLYKQTGD